MKKITILAAFLLTATLSFAQVTRGTIGQGSFTDWANQTTTCYGIDFDNDGIHELKIKGGYDYQGNQCDNSSIEYIYDKVFIVVPSGDYWDVFALLENGATVNSASQFAGEGDAMIYDYTQVSTTASYVGFKFKKNNNSYYAYAKIHRSGNQIVWDEVYYNATANAGITVGQTATVGIRNVEADEAAPAIRKYMYRNRIYIERGDATYSIDGRRLK